VESGEPRAGSPDADGSKAAYALTIEAVAEATGLTVRNVRAYQSRGLLPPPKMRGRTGYYSHKHVARLRLIQQLQSDGFNLAAIAALLTAGVDEAERMHRLSAPQLDRTNIDLTEGISPAARSALDGRTEEELVLLLDAGIIHRRANGEFSGGSSALVTIARQLNQLGVTYNEMLDLAVELARRARMSVVEISPHLAGLRGNGEREVVETARAFVFELFRTVFATTLERTAAALDDGARAAD
jgi:DNA-binding transcriptional MerR regulator